MVEITFLQSVWPLQMGVRHTGAADCFGTQLVHSASQGGCCNIMEELVKQGHSLEAIGHNGRSCLHYAARGVFCLAARSNCMVSGRITHARFSHHAVRGLEC